MRYPSELCNSSLAVLWFNHAMAWKLGIAETNVSSIFSRGRHWMHMACLLCSVNCMQALGKCWLNKRLM